MGGDRICGLAPLKGVKVIQFHLTEVPSLKVTPSLAVRLHLSTKIRVESRETADHHR